MPTTLKERVDVLEQEVKTLAALVRGRSSCGDSDAEVEFDWRAAMREALASGPAGDRFAVGVEEAKAAQAKAWRGRLTRTRRAMSGT
jgi:hypothetical protein